MISGFQCICGMFVIVHSMGSGTIPCPVCGTIWSEKTVTLFDGTIYNLGKNGRWGEGERRPKPVPIAVSRFFGEEE